MTPPTTTWVTTTGYGTVDLHALNDCAWNIVRHVAAIRGTCPFCHYDQRTHSHEAACLVTTARRIADLQRRSPPPAAVPPPCPPPDAFAPRQPNYAADY